MVDSHVESEFRRFCRTGDPDALAVVYDATADRLLRAALHLVPSTAAAEDLVQATFVAVIESAERFDAERPLLPWLLGILGNQAKLQTWRVSREPDVERLRQPMVSDPELIAERAEFDRMLDQTIDRLPDVYRPVLYLRLRYGLTTAEIGLSLGRAPGTVRAQLTRGLERLRRALPIGFASALAVAVEAQRGLACVREAVLAHASHGEVVSVGVVLGGVVMKKWISGLVAVALIVVASAWFYEGVNSGASPAAEPAVKGIGVRLPEITGDEGIAVPDTSRELVAAKVPVEETRLSTPEVDPTLGHLSLQVVWRGDRTPAVGVTVVIVSGVQSLTNWGDRKAMRTDAAGRISCSLQPGSIGLRALRGGESTVVLTAGQVTEAVLGIPAGYAATIAVRDDVGRPVDEAEIWLSEAWSSTRGHVVGRTDAEGRYRIRHVRHDHHFAVRRRGYAPSRQYPLHGSPGSEFEFEVVLAPGGGSVVGGVHDAKGRPIAGARILIGREQSKNDRRHDDGSYVPGPPPRLVVATGDGRFVADSLPIGSAPVQVLAQGYAAWRGAVTVVRGPAEIDIILEPAPVVRGLVTLPDGEPSRFALIWTGEHRLFHTRVARCDVDGRYEIAGMPVGEVELIARDIHGGKRTARRRLTLRAGEEVEWNPTVQSPVTARGSAGGEGEKIEALLVGRVVDRSGQPVLDVRVVARAASNPNGGAGRGAVSDPDGRFQVRVPWEEVALRVLRRGDWRHWPVGMAARVRVGDGPVEIVVPDASTELAVFRGQVVDPAGVGVAAQVQVWHEQLKLWRSFDTDSKTGRFEMKGVWPGTLEVEIRSTQHPWQRLGAHQLGAGADVDIGVITMLSSARVRGRLSARGGVIPEDMHGSVQDVRGREVGVLDVKSGAFTSSPLATGDYRLMLAGRRVETVRVPFSISGGSDVQLDVELVAAALRRVRVELPAGAKGVTWARVFVRNISLTRVIWIGAATAKSEWIAETAMPIGEYDVRVTTSDGMKGRATLKVTSLLDVTAPLLIPVAAK